MQRLKADVAEEKKGSAKRNEVVKSRYRKYRAKLRRGSRHPLRRRNPNKLIRKIPNFLDRGER